MGTGSVNAPEDGGGLHPLTLAFRNSAFEKRFMEDYRASNLAHWRRCHWLAMLFYGVFAGIIGVSVPTACSVCLVVGFAVVIPMFLVGFVFSYTPPYRRLWQAINAGYVAVTGGGALVIAAAVGPPHLMFALTGLLFCFLFGYAVIRLRFVPAAASGGLITLAFLVMAGDLTGGDTTALLVSSFYVVGVNLLGMIIAYGLERHTRREYRLRLALDEERQRVDAANQALEERVEQRTQALRQGRSVLAQEIGRREEVERERSDLERRFQHAQRMESVGRLAGGISHDFNNLLTVINSYADFAVESLEPDDPLAEDIEEIRKAGERATTLTRQLLAFSRTQVLEPQVVDLNDIIRGVQRMLQRVIGEDIELGVAHADERLSVEADPGQLEQVLMNLVVNARDAMPKGGRLAIETAAARLDESFAEAHPGVEPGEHVRCSVSDDGVGMSEETLERIFEPFFTTKDKGRGTGLGLATAYGIIQQSGGSIWVRSVLGEGTTFDIYLPRVRPVGAADGAMGKSDVSGGTETILVVEDEAAVRLMVERLLSSAGYRVLVASGGEEALAIVGGGSDPIDLLLTDVIMPSMSGTELAEQLAALRPELKVLFMSGYTGTAIEQYGMHHDDVQLIAKPFRRRPLLERVRALLDGNL